MEKLYRKIIKQKVLWWGAEAHICNPSYLVGGDQEDQCLRPVQFTRPHLNQWLGTMVCTCHPGYMGKHKWEDHNPGHLDIETKSQK
jgi:hypothetical protein